MSGRFTQFSLGGFTIFRMKSWITGGVIGLLFVGLVSAGEMPALNFSIKPRLCVLTAEEEACYDELEVSWQAREQMSLCLYQSGRSEPLKCWENVSSGKHNFVLSATQDITFQLREPNTKLVVSEAFQVIHDNKKYRRQRRNPWSFF